MLPGSPLLTVPGGAVWARQPPVHLGLTTELEEDAGACLGQLLAGWTNDWKVLGAGPLPGPGVCSV